MISCIFFAFHPLKRFRVALSFVCVGERRVFKSWILGRLWGRLEVLDLDEVCNPGFW